MQFSADQLLNSTVYDQAGTKVGRVRQVYLNDASGEPSWVTVRTGFFGINESLVPLEGARLNENNLTVPFGEQVIKASPNYDPGHHLDGADEDDLYRHYGPIRSDSDRGEGTARDRDERAARNRNQPQQQSIQEQLDRPETADRPGQHGDEQFGGGEPVVQPEATVQHEQSERPGEDRAQPDVSGSGDSTHERDLIKRERELLDRERNLLDRERTLAEQEGNIRPRLRRHNPDSRG